MFIELIDNTDLGHGINSNIKIKQNNHMRLVVPNEGILEDGSRVHFFSEGLKRINNKFWLDLKNVFFKNGELQKRGIIVYKKTIAAKNDNVLLEETPFFKVFQSNIDSILPGFTVIVNARTAYRFNVDKKEFFYVNVENVFLVFKGDDMRPGPDYVIVEKEEFESNGIHTDKMNSGVWDGTRYYFDDFDYELGYDSTQYLVVNKKNIKLLEQV